MDQRAKKALTVYQSCVAQFGRVSKKVVERRDLNTLYNVFLVNRLIVSSYKVIIEVKIHIINALNAREGPIHIEIINVKRVLRKLYFKLTEKLCAIYD